MIMCKYSIESGFPDVSVQEALCEEMLLMRQHCIISLRKVKRRKEKLHENENVEWKSTNSLFAVQS